MVKNKHIRIFVTFVAFALIIYAADEYKDYRVGQIKHEAYAEIIPLIGLSDDDDFFTTVDKIRLFLFENSVYSDGEDFHKIWGQHTLIAKHIIASADGTAGKRAPLECSSRSGVLESILITLGYKVRSIAVYAYGENYNSHTFTEVQDPKTGKWHTQDVQFNIYWKMKETGERASIYELVQHDVSNYIPCRTPDQCHWDLPNREGSFAKNMPEKFGLASIKDYQRGKRPLVVNTKRFDLNTPQKVGEQSLTYCDWIPKNCREEITKF